MIKYLLVRRATGVVSSTVQNFERQREVVLAYQGGTVVNQQVLDQLHGETEGKRVQVALHGLGQSEVELSRVDEVVADEAVHGVQVPADVVACFAPEPLKKNTRNHVLKNRFKINSLSTENHEKKHPKYTAIH
jgi:hypothetical protein